MKIIRTEMGAKIDLRLRYVIKRFVKRATDDVVPLEREVGQPWRLDHTYYHRPEAPKRRLSILCHTDSCTSRRFWLACRSLV